MTDRRFVVFRIDDTATELLWGELRNGRLRQGWGCPGMQLMENGQPVPLDTFAKRYVDAARKHFDEHADTSSATKRYWILARMLYLKKDDVIVVPKMPSWSKFAIVKPYSGYEFERNPLESIPGTGIQDYRHILHIAQDSLKVFSCDCSVEARTVKKKLRAYQSAVNNVYDADFITAINVLMESPGDTTAKGPKELFGEVCAPFLKEILNELRKFPFGDLENLVAEAFGSAGYEVAATHHYNRKGGDADVILTRDLPLLGDLADTNLKIYIQVKQKTGIDTDDVNGVEQLVKITAGEGNCIKVLASTADDFTPECKRKAEEAGVFLVDGESLAGALVKHV